MSTPARLSALLAAPLVSAREWLDLAISAIAPPSCTACRGPVTTPGDPLCVACRAALPWLRGPLCRRCALPLPCAPGCRAASSAIDRCWAPLAHEGAARSIVHAYKHRGALRLADLMAAQIVAAAPEGLLVTTAVLVPVPTHPLRARRRGFDHAALLTRAVAERAGLPIASCLQRRGRASRQVGASRSARLTPGRIDVVAHGDVPTHAVLVDDVQTTGATLDACATALHAAGGIEVSAVTYVRALR